MDPLAHGLFGASAALAVARSTRDYRLAALAGFIGGTVPDLDVLIRSNDDPLLQIQYHRHFTHALVMIPVLAALVAGMLWTLLKKHLSFAWIFIFATMGAALHGVVDATTSYGTHLLWPFTDRRESWSIMTIIDPIVTLLLLTGVLSVLWTKRKRVFAIALVLVGLYFGFGAVQMTRAVDAMKDLADTRGHTIASYEVKPTLFNIILWRSTYVAGGRIYADGIRLTPMGRVTVYPGESVAALDLARDFPTLSPTSVQARDIERFHFFSAGFLGRHPNDPTLIGDMRYAMLPQSMKPLWGIRIDPKHPDRHVTFENFRSRDDETLRQFWTMLRGQKI